ncbi:MAG: aminotransferase class I/II-fold pyridoxal phosphate-dependent enzyme [Bacteroidales bacterium]
MTKQTNIDVDFSFEGNLSKLAEDYNAIDLSGNYTSFPVPEIIEEKVFAYLKTTTGNAPTEGTFQLRNALSEYISKKYFKSYCPVNEITITAGATQAIFTAIASTVKEGDEAIIFEPSYESLSTAIEISGARPIFIKIKDGENPIDWSEVQKAITTRTKLIIICTPHNILGRVLSSDDMENLQKLINGTKIRVISDESLAEIVYSDSASSSATFYPKLTDNCFVVGSLSLSVGVPGWKIGYCLAPKALMDKFRKVQRAVINSVNNPFQLALADYIARYNNLFPNIELLERNRNTFRDILKDSKFKILPNAGGSFQILNYSAISTVKDTEFVEMLIKEHGVAATPLSTFYHDKTCKQQIRINLAAHLDKLVEAANRLKKI